MDDQQSDLGTVLSFMTEAIFLPMKDVRLICWYIYSINLYNTCVLKHNN